MFQRNLIFVGAIYFPGISNTLLRPSTNNSVQRIVLLSAFFTSILTAFGDSVLTKDGQKYEGKIVTETPEFVIMEIPFSETIMEKRNIPRSEIAKLERVSGEDIAFQRLQETPNPDLILSSDQLGELLDGRLRPFVAEFPNFSKLPEVKKRIQTLEAEEKRLEDGEIKIFGMWLSPSEQTAEKYQIEAARIFLEMRNSFDQDAFGVVLNEFSVLSSKYPESIAYIRSIPLARRAATSLVRQLDFAIGNLPTTLAKRQQSLDLAGIGDRNQVQAALERQDAYAVSLAERAREQKQDFYQILDYDEKGMTQMRLSAQKASQEAAKVDPTPRERAIKAIVQTHSFIESEDLSSAETTTEAIKENWPEYEGLARLEQRIDAAKRAAEEKRLAAKKAAEAAGNDPAANPPASATPEPTPSP